MCTDAPAHDEAGARRFWQRKDGGLCGEGVPGDELKGRSPLANVHRRHDRRDAMDVAAKAERDATVEHARDSIREQMTPEIRDQARREALTEVCSFATRAFR